MLGMPYRVGKVDPTVSTVEWPRGEATACKAVYTGSNPVSTSQNAARPHNRRPKNNQHNHAPVAQSG